MVNILTISLIDYRLSYTGLALTSLLSEQNDAIHQRYDVIIQSVCETLNDIMKEDTDDNTIKYVE